jgi:hypothetical protein
LRFAGLGPTRMFSGSLVLGNLLLHTSRHRAVCEHEPGSKGRSTGVGAAARPSAKSDA